MNSIEKLKEEGRSEGLTRGRAEGRRESLKKLLALKFGDLSLEQGAAVDGADLDTLDRYLERVLTADSLDAVFGC